ncbi:MAG: hypothetical protein E6Y56_03195 [Negativicoccus succinicivorans]|uniref:hypothetical protein n=1 Tax=Negativicoccus succinicivorans TaxID=620903 RepID=UPI00290506AC|nr:hypothetical protein [Negativicoccus succinicivorans]MDU2930131.1 hypothetical protein [Negativicoccus succinicivorans]MDU4558569.1 hypothetical protein [Negativicoccus succinicivorans]MDU4575776.1 hypothetical protein [Negativicoccus succinicivorans]
MVVVEKRKEDNRHVEYDYYIWDKRDEDNHGSIRLLKGHGEHGVSWKPAPADTIEWYFHHAISLILNMEKNNEFKDRDVAIWE